MADGMNPGNGCCGAGVAGGDVETSVRERYAAGARAVEPELCCPTQGYDTGLLAALPAEIIEKDYGCGDPTAWVGEGDTVVDLGSGAGKACYMMAQKVGPRGRVIGVDFNDAMLDLARKYQDEVAGKIGYRNTEFRKGRIQDLALDLDRAQAWLAERPAGSVEALAEWEARCDRLRAEEPLIPTGIVDAVVSNCVLNLVRPADKVRLFDEIFRVLRRGGRAVISDIVCDEAPPESMKNDPELWSGCISGAFLEDEFLRMFERAGFYGVEILARQADPWRVVDGIEFRSVTVRAWKGKQGPCRDKRQAVVYRGPFKCIADDDGHVIERGTRFAVCDKTFALLMDPKGPYAGQFDAVEPRGDAGEGEPWDPTRPLLRHPRETKGMEYSETTSKPGEECCGPGCC